MKPTNLLAAKFYSLVITCLILAGCRAVAAQNVVTLPTSTATWPAPSTPTATIVSPTMIPPVNTATPTPTPTHQPRPTLFPTPTITPAPEFGYYSDPTIGFSFAYPSAWEVEEELGIFIQNQDPRVFIAGRSNVINENETIEDYVAQFYGWIGDADQVEMTASTSLLLEDGTEAQVIEFAAPDSFFQARATVTMRGRRVFMVLILAPETTFTEFPHTMETIAASMQVESPHPFGISRDNALVLAGGQPRTLDPILTHGSAGGRIGQIFTGLVMLDQNLQVIPDLAESWDVTEAGTVYTFYLRENALFHDGRPVTAHDVKFSWERAADPANESDTVETYLGDIVGVKNKARGEADHISGVEVIDDHTLQVTIDAPKPYFLAKLTYPTSFIVDEQNVKAEDWQHQPNGTGPFRLVTWQDDEVFIVARNNDFYLNPPSLDHIIYMMQPDVPIWMYENDEIDETGIGVSNIERVTDPTNPLSRELHIVPSLCTTRLIFGPDHPPFDDPSVRQAFAHALDRETLGRIVFKGMVEPANSILPPGMPGYSPTINAPKFDPDKARQLLAKSTYGSADNLPDVVLTVSGQGSGLSNFESALLDMWRTHLGVKVVVEQIDPDTYSADLRDKSRQLINSGWCADYPDPENFLDILYHSESRENTGKYKNSEIDSLLEQARTEIDPETRLAMYHEIEQKIIDDTPDILLHHGQSYFLLKPQVRNYLLTPTSLALNWRVISIEQTVE